MKRILVLATLFVILAGVGRRAMSDTIVTPDKSLAQKQAELQVPVADTPAPKRALIIGLDSYMFANPLTACREDALHIAEFLHDSWGFSTDDITLISDKASTQNGPQPTIKSVLDRAVSTWVGTINPGDEVVFFFSGHGAHGNDGEDYLVPLDGDPNDVAASCVSYAKLKSAVEAKNPRRALFITDACRDLATSGGKSISGGEQFGKSNEVDPQRPEIVEMRSCEAGQISRELTDGSGSVYTKFLLQGLRGDAGALDNDNVTIGSLGTFVSRQTRDYVAQYYHEAQTPQLLSSYVDMVLGKPAEAPHLGSTRTSLIDDATMMYVPAGEFLMGSSDVQMKAAYQIQAAVNKTAQQSWFDVEGPQHRVYLDAYWIDKTPVTVAQYRKFCDATNRTMPAAPNWGWKDDHPMVNVTWDDATAYAKWAGKRLPTEAEWEKAARGTDGRTYPWGNDWDGGRLMWSNWQNGQGSTAPVGSYPSGASPCGALDMAGNVWQWCADWFDPDYYKNSPDRNPTGPPTAPPLGQFRVIRGGSWYNLDSTAFRTSARGSNTPGAPNFLDGFRCVEGP